MIKNVVFDLGGVLIELAFERALSRFKEIGVWDIETILDPYEQKGFFLEVENGKLDAEGFCQKMREHTGKNLSYEEIEYAWLGFAKETPQYKMDYLLKLREKYKVYLLSNTNPFVLGWARRGGLTDTGRSIEDYFDKIYASYEIGITKPNPAIFEAMITDSGMNPAETLFVDDGLRNVEAGQALGFHTYQPKNREDWRDAINEIMSR